MKRLGRQKANEVSEACEVAYQNSDGRSTCRFSTSLMTSLYSTAVASSVPSGEYTGFGPEKRKVSEKSIAGFANFRTTPGSPATSGSHSRGCAAHRKLSFALSSCRAAPKNRAVSRPAVLPLRCSPRPHAEASREKVGRSVSTW